MYLLRVVYVRVGFAIFKIYRVMIKIRPGNWLFLTASGTNDMYITNGIVRVSGGWHVIMSCPCVARHGVSCLAPRQYSNPSQITLRCYKLYLEATLVLQPVSRAKLSALCPWNFILVLLRISGRGVIGRVTNATWTSGWRYNQNLSELYSFRDVPDKLFYSPRLILN